MKKYTLFILGFVVLGVISLKVTAQSNTQGSETIIVGITAELPVSEVNHQGNSVTVKRIQDTDNKMVSDFAKTSRPCPPFCIVPMQAAPGVATIGEVELLNFLDQVVNKNQGLLVDARLPRFYNAETIPGSVNIPFVLFTSAPAEILPLLGVKVNESGDWDFSQAMDLALWCNGPWCEQSPRAIKGLVKAGYPASKLNYYRGGMQMWKLFGLTTIQPSSNEVVDSQAVNN